MFKKIILDKEITRWSVNEEGQVRNDETGKILKGTLLHTYLYVNFRWNGKCKNKAVHRLVAEAFLPNPDNLPYVIHLDGNRLNNCLNNLKWMSEKEKAEASIGHFAARPITTIQTDLEGEEWRRFRDTEYFISNKGRIKNMKTKRITLGSQADCGYKRFGIKMIDGNTKYFLVHQLVYECFVSSNFNEINHINGIKTDNRVENLENVSHKENMLKACYETNAWNFRRVGQYDKNNNLIRVYSNASEAGRAMGILPSSMRNNIRTRGGKYKEYIFKYLDDKQ